MLILPEQFQPRLDNVPDSCPDVVIVPNRDLLYKYHRDREQSVVMMPRRISGEFNGLAEELMRGKKYTSYDLTEAWSLLDRTDYRAELEMICMDMAEMKRKAGCAPTLRVVNEYIDETAYKFHTDTANSNKKGRYERVMCCYNAPVTEGLARLNTVRSGRIYLPRDSAQILRFGIGDIWIQACGQDKSEAYLHRAVEIGPDDPPRLLVVC